MFTPFLMALAVAAPMPKAAPKEPAPLVGEWVTESATIRGQPRPEFTVAGLRFTADGKGQVTGVVNVGTKDKKEELPLKFDPAKAPAEIDVLSFRGIYTVEKDTLTLCLAVDGPRPTTFDPRAEKTVMIWTLKRAK
jgi:uncharacterized protein (TIGR03067 family)